MTKKTEENFWRIFEYRPKVRELRRQQTWFPYKLRKQRPFLPGQQRAALQGDTTEHTCTLNLNEREPGEGTVAVNNNHGLAKNLETPGNWEETSGPRSDKEKKSAAKQQEEDVSRSTSLTGFSPDAFELPSMYDCAQLAVYHSPICEEATADNAGTWWVNNVQPQRQLGHSWYEDDELPGLKHRICLCSGCTAAFFHITHRTLAGQIPVHGGNSGFGKLVRETDYGRGSETVEDFEILRAFSMSSINGDHIWIDDDGMEITRAHGVLNGQLERFKCQLDEIHREIELVNRRKFWHLPSTGNTYFNILTILNFVPFCHGR